MPPQHEYGQSQPVQKAIEPVIEEERVYSREAFDFVRRGLTYTVDRVHAAQTDPKASRHVSGAQLCEGLREFAIMRWGFLARAVLRRWNVTRTEDFGRIVFTLVESGEMSKTDEDTVEDFNRVYDFATAFEAGYRIERRSIENRS
jgi:uncharacterized repeat protein (TIGR04138 family)